MRPVDVHCLSPDPHRLWRPTRLPLIRQYPDAHQWLAHTVIGMPCPNPGLNALDPFCQHPAHVIAQGNALAHQQATIMMQVQDSLLPWRLGLDKPLTRSLHRLTDGLCVIVVVLVGFQVRFNENRRIIRTVCSSRLNSLDQQCAPPQASMPSRQGSSLEKNCRNCDRFTCLRACLIW